MKVEIERDGFDKLNVLFAGIMAFGTVLIAFYSIPKATEDIKESITISCIGSLFSGIVTYNGQPANPEVRITNHDTLNMMEIPANEKGEFIFEGGNYPNFLQKSNKVTIRACANDACLEKQFIFCRNAEPQDISFNIIKD